MLTSRVIPVRRSSSWKEHGHWSISEFAGAIFPASTKRKPIAVLVGYFDESGISQNDKVALVGGALADSVIWSRLERPWRDNIKTTGVSWFHAVDCEHGNDEFQNISRGLRESLVNGLSKALVKIEPQCFAGGVIRADWEFAPDFVKQRSLNDPYYFAFETCMQQISRYSRDRADGEPIALVFAKQREYQKRAETLHGYYHRAIDHGITGIGSITFADPRCLIQLQAADMIAYEAQRYFVEGKNDSKVRQALRNFENTSAAFDVIVHDRASLEKLVSKPGRWTADS